MLIIGLISGTSMDAIDAVLVEARSHGDELRLRQLGFTMHPFDPQLRERVQRLMPPLTGSTAEVCELNVLLGHAFADAARAVAEEAAVDLGRIDLIASHGQTVYHQTADGAVPSSLQLGAPGVIAVVTGRTVVADFRLADIAAGGQGAPLVPYLDALLFGHASRHRAVQNIGGIANVTYVPVSGPVIAFDTGPGNMLLDQAACRLTNGGQSHDPDGALARAGTAAAELVAEWLHHPYFIQPPPKSTGREQWGADALDAYLVRCRDRGLGTEDTMATLTLFTARSITDAYRRFLGTVDDVFVSGGGARNPTLMAMLRRELPEATWSTTAAVGLDADAKEAVAFAVMGYATLSGWHSNVPSATGAKHPVLLGSITPGANYLELVRAVAASQVPAPRRIRMSG